MIERSPWAERRSTAGKKLAAGAAAYIPRTPRQTNNPPIGTTKLAPQWGPAFLRKWLLAAGVVYLLAVWLDAIGTGIPNQLLPRSVRFFVQEAALFPHAVSEVVEWRVEAWMCSEQRFAEIDVRPFFPIRSDDKESRFYRAMFFHHRERKVMQALDEYIVRRQNSAHPEQRIGGVLLLSLRVPIPVPGSPEPRYQRLPLSSFPPTIERSYWYTTGTEARERSCSEPP